MAYTTVEDVKRVLRAVSDKVKVSPATIEPGQDYDISESEITDFINEVEGAMNFKINALSLSTTNTEGLKYIATRLAAYEIYLSLYPQTSFNELPIAIQRWKKNADEAFESLCDTKKGSAGAIGTPNWGDQV